MTSLARDRYHAICDERDAYQQMQSEMTSAIDAVSIRLKSSEAEKEALSKELSQIKSVSKNALIALQNSLAVVGVCVDTPSTTSNIHAMHYTQ